MPFDYADVSLLGSTLLLQEATTAVQGISSANFLGLFPVGVATGIIGTLLGLADKYLMDYRLQSRRLALDEKRYGSEVERARWRLQAEARHEVYAVVGSTQSSFVRAAMELHDRLSNFLENPDNTRPWLRGRTTRCWLKLAPAPEDDGTISGNSCAGSSTSTLGDASPKTPSTPCLSSLCRRGKTCSVSILLST